MKMNYFIAAACALSLTASAYSQTGGGAGAGATAGGGGAGAGAGAGAVGNGTVNSGAGAVQNQVNPGAAAVNPRQQALPPREQLPPNLQSQQESVQGATNAGMQLYKTNWLGGRTNGFPFTNQFGFTNRFGTNFADWRTNRFRHTNDNDFDDTNGLGWRSNRWGTNEFGWRSNRFRGTNGFGGRTNRFGTNTFGFGTNGFTNEFSISNSIAISNQFGLGPNDVGGFIPGGGSTAVSGGGATAPAVPATAAAPPTETPMAATGPGANRIYGSAATNRSTGVALQDRSVSESDRILLQNVRKLVIPRLEAMGAWGPAVHFWIGDGNVTMVGTVQSKEARAEAEAMVSQIAGVNSVKDNLFVGNIDPNASETDQELLYRVREAVLPQVAAGNSSSAVDFTVRDGLVTVVGRAANVEEAHRIQKMVQQVAGVDHVKNALLISDANGSTVQPLPTTLDNSNPGSTQENLTPTGRGTSPQREPPTPQPAPDQGQGTPRER